MKTYSGVSVQPLVTLAPALWLVLRMLHKALICHSFAEISPSFKPSNQGPLRSLFCPRFSGGNFSAGHRSSSRVISANLCLRAVPTGRVCRVLCPFFSIGTMPALCRWTMCFFVVLLFSTMFSTLVAWYNVQHTDVCVLWVPHPVLTNRDMHIYSKRSKRRFQVEPKLSYYIPMASFLIDFSALGIVNRATADKGKADYQQYSCLHFHL